MYFISCFTNIDYNSKNHFVGLSNFRCYGYVETYEEAINIMHNNISDIREFTYTYGLIEKYESGIHPYCGKGNRQFLKWDDEKQGFYEIEEPSDIECNIGLCLG